MIHHFIFLLQQTRDIEDTITNKNDYTKAEHRLTPNFFTLCTRYEKNRRIILIPYVGIFTFGNMELMIK
jgi:hypothetical protein